MNKKLLALFGLKFNPFCPEVPVEAFEPSAPLESFFWKIEQSLVREGGFALITGDPGTGNYVKRSVMQSKAANSFPSNK